MTDPSRPAVAPPRLVLLLVPICLAGTGCLNRSGLTVGNDPDEEHTVNALSTGSGMSSASLQLQELTNACVANQVLNAFQVTNNGTTPVALSDISIRMWVNDTTAAQQIVTDVNYGGCATSGSSCVHQVSGVKTTVTSVSPACGPDDNHQANWEITISTTDTTALAVGGRWTNLQTGTHLRNYANFTPGTSRWFSPCLGGAYVEDPHYAVYYKGDLVFASGVNTPSCRGPQGTQQLTGYRTPAIASAPLVGPVPPQTPIQLTVGLPVRNQAALKAFIQAVSSPSQPATYGHFLTPQQFASTYGPLASDYQKVIDWATAAGFTVTQTYPSNMLVSLRGTAATIEKALFVNLNYYGRPDGTQFHAPDREPSLNLAPTVLRIGNLEDHYVPEPLVDGNYAQLLGPTDFHGTYAFCHPELQGEGQTIAIFSYRGGYDLSDVEAYETRAGIAASDFTTVSKVGVNGASTDPSTITKYLGEADLDVQMALSMAPKAKIIMYVSPLDAGGTNATLALIANTEPLASQVSSSWGMFTDELTQQLLDQLASQGQSFFHSSGDNGGVPYDYEGIWDMENVTLVGGTNIRIVPPWVLSEEIETAWNGSGGGILTNVGKPYYQNDVPGLENINHRSFPDVAAYASGIESYVGGKLEVTCCAGTSASAPLWAGFIALANQLRAEHGLKPLGFINPAIYDIGKSADYVNTFNDILAGKTPSRHPGHPAGEPTYSAGPKFDLATGWGSPKCGLIDKLATPPDAGCTYKFWIPDCDNDGYGNPHTAFIYSCTAPTGTPTCPYRFSGTYVNVSGDCCDKDANAHPDQNQYFRVRSGCDFFEYNCDGEITKQSNGPTDCFGVASCVPNSAGTACEWAGLPAHCNGNATDYHTAECGHEWTLDTETCVTASTGRCVSSGNGGPGGTQLCN